MSHHRNKHYKHSTALDANSPVQRPPSLSRPVYLRVLSFLGLALPLILYILTLSFTLATIYNPSFALSYPASSTGIVTKFTYKASPFFKCSLVQDELFSATRKYTCSRLQHATGHAGRVECANTNDGDPQKCQQIVLSAGLFVAGAVLSGVAVLLAAVVLGLGYSAAVAPTTGTTSTTRTATTSSGHDAPVLDSPEDQTSKDEETNNDDNVNGNTTNDTSISTDILIPDLIVPLLGGLATLLALLAAACIWLGQDIGVNALVIGGNPQEPVPPEYETHWFMGIASLVFPSVAYLAAGIGAFVYAASGRALAK